MTIAFDMSPDVKIVPPRLPWPVLASGKSPLADRRMAKNRCGTSISKREGLALSTKCFIGTSDATSSTADTGASHGVEADLSPVQDAAVMAAVDWRRRRRWAEMALQSMTDGSANPNAAAEWENIDAIMSNLSIVECLLRVYVVLFFILVLHSRYVRTKGYTTWS